MTRTVRFLAAPAALLALVLGGCAPEASEPPDEAAVQEWLDQWDHVADTDTSTLGSAAGRPVTVAEHEEGIDDGVRQGVTITFESPVEPSEMLFSCFGVEEMTASFSSVGESESYGLLEEDLVCADSPHEIAGGLELASVTSITMAAVEEHGYGAWAMEIHGEE